MLSRIPAVRAVLMSLMFFVVAACSSANEEAAGLGPQKVPATPGSERDFALNVGDRVFFPTDQTSLTDAAKDTLRRQATWLKIYGNVKVQVQGHADERGTREYNLALSARRAASTKAYLVSAGVAPDRVTTISYGKERPVALCDAESCWSQNRRAVTAVISGAAS